EFALAGADVVLRVERREVATDDLVRAIAVDPFGADVPRHHATARIEHEDRVVAHALDELSEHVPVAAHARRLANVATIGRASATERPLPKAWAPASQVAQGSFGSSSLPGHSSAPKNAIRSARSASVSWRSTIAGFLFLFAMPPPAISLTASSSVATEPSWKY